MWYSYPTHKPHANIDRYVDFLVAFENPYYVKPKFQGDLSSSNNMPKYYTEVAQWIGDKFLTSKPVVAFMRIPPINFTPEAPNGRK